MGEHLISEKKQLRRQCSLLRKNLTTLERSEKSIHICSNLFQFLQIRAVKTVFTYVSYKTEVDTTLVINKLLEQGKNVVIPHVCTQSEMNAVQLIHPTQELEKGFKGIPELHPDLVKKRMVPPDQIEVAIIPGLAFDPNGARLGYGGGYYDRFLSNHADNAFRIGVCFKEQIVDNVPTEGHDIAMDMIFHDKGFIGVK